MSDLIRLAFRLDDPSETSNQGVEAGIIEVLRRHQVSATFATIPFRIVDGERVALSRARAQPLIDATHEGLIEIALHGHTHRRRHPEPAPPTEFSTCPRDEQHMLISEGKQHLEAIFGIRITGFVPPWNSYDSATVECLLRLGFDYLSAGWHMPDARACALRLLPRTVRFAAFAAAFAEALRFEAANPVLIVVLHHYEFAESGIPGSLTDLDQFDSAVEWALAHKNLRVSNLSQLASEVQFNNRGIDLQQRLAGNRLLRPFLPQTLLLDAPIWRSVATGFANNTR